MKLIRLIFNVSVNFQPPVEPPAPAICGGTGATLGGQVVVPVHGGELVAVVGREAVAGVTRVASHPYPVVLVLSVNPAHTELLTGLASYNIST